MRLVTKAEFLTLREGTLFTPLDRPWVFGPVRVKGDTCGPNDFYSRSLDWVDGNTSEEAMDRLEAMRADPAVSFPAERAYGREGDYDLGTLYLVHEAADVKLLLAELQHAYNQNG